jgi:hypothetical protein
MAAFDRQGVPRILLEQKDERKADFWTAIGTLQAFSLISAEKVSHSQHCLDEQLLPSFISTSELLPL